MHPAVFIIVLVLCILGLLLRDIVPNYIANNMRKEGWTVYWKITGGGGYDGGYDYESVAESPDGRIMSLWKGWREYKTNKIHVKS
jgi:hypothetical protein